MTRARGVFVAVGANVDPARNVREGLVKLDAVAPIVRASPFYVTPPVARPEQPPFWNGVVEVRPRTGDPEDFQFLVLRDVEARQGRVREADAHAPRPLDLDLVLWRDRVARSERLTLPDPDLVRRPFLARALLDLEPDLVLPGDDAPLATRVPDARTGAWPLAEPAPWP